MAIRLAVVHSARAAHIFSAGIKCRHCSMIKMLDYSIVPDDIFVIYVSLLTTSCDIKVIQKHRKYMTNRK